MIPEIRQYIKEHSRDIGNLLLYLKHTFEGNKVERLTDFAECDHPVLLLYGFGATRRTFAVLEERLRRDGFCVFSLNLGGIFDTFNTRCIEELAEFVDEKVHRLCQRYKLKKISIIGHSKGGLIGRYYVKRLGGHRKVRTLITLGTPHNGNPWALLGLATPLLLIAKSIRQLFPMSPFIRSLKEGRFPSHVRFVSIYSKEDRVCFYKSAMLDIPPNSKKMFNVEVKGLGHADLVMRKTAYKEIKKALRAGEKEDACRITPKPTLQRKKVSRLKTR